MGVQGRGPHFHDELRKAAEADPWYREMMQQVSPTEGLLRADGLLWTIDGRFDVPADREVQSKLLFEARYTPTGGHLGERRLSTIAEDLLLGRDGEGHIEDYVRGCMV
jgi:hypothetical protein